MRETWSAVYMEAAPAETAAVISSCCPEQLLLDFLAEYWDEAAQQALQGADFAIVATHPMLASLVDGAPRLKPIQHQGVGYDRTDVANAARRGIPVALCPERCVDAPHCRRRTRRTHHQDGGMLCQHPARHPGRAATQPG